MIDPNRLYTALLNTGLQNKDNALYQVIHDLIGNVAKLANATTVTTTTVVTSGLTNAQLAARILIDDIDSNSPDSGGSSSNSGIIGPPGLDGLDAEDLYGLLGFPQTSDFDAATVFRTGGQSVTSSVALVDDNTLQLPLGIGKHRFFLFYYISSGASSGGFKIAVTFSGSTSNCMTIGLTTQNNAANAGNSAMLGGFANAFDTPVATTITTPGAFGVAIIEGMITVTAPGLLKGRIAQFTPSGTPTVFDAPSRLTAQRLA